MLPALRRRSLPPGTRPPLADRTRQALFGTLPGRLLVIGLAVKLLAYLVRLITSAAATPIDVIDKLASLALIIGAGYFLYRLIARAKRRLLWRVRRKLILSYVFIGVVPVLLVVAFFALSGLLLFFNVGAYLVRSAIGEAADEARFQAETAAVEIQRGPGPRNAGEILTSWHRKLVSRYPGASVTLVPTGPAPPAEPPLAARSPAGAPGAAAGGPTRSVRPPSGTSPPSSAQVKPIALGPWTHLRPPQVLPSWVSRTGFSGLLGVVPDRTASPEQGIGGGEDAFLVIRAIGFPEGPRPAYAVIVDVPLQQVLTERIREQTSVKLGRVTFASDETVARGLQGSRSSQLAPLIPRPAQSAASPGTEISRKRRIPWVVFLEHTDWPTGTARTATMSIELNIADIYDRLSAGQARLGGGGGLSFGSLVLLVLLLLAVLFLIIEAAALVMGLVLAKSITGSMHQLFAGTERVRQGDLGHRIEIKSRDQLGELAESFNQMTTSITDLLRTAEEKKRLEEELRIARSIQMSLLPQGELSVPGLSITAICEPAREVGGDYYDLLPLGDGCLGLLVADVSGKGTSAALYMAELKGLMLSLCRIHRSPRQLLIAANRIISDHLDSRSFITMTYAVIDLQARTMTYARAGHTPLIYRPERGDRAPGVQILAPDGLVLGLRIDNGRMFESLLEEATLKLETGDLLLFFTDGISEAMNTESDCFGESRLGQIIDEHGDLPPEELRERILREVAAFVGGAPQHDDMTMILVKVGDPVRAALPGALEALAV
jgi:serine phosphatase RsbU (regulator of sigma subunit)